jgi:hypothetical protein
LFAHVLQDRRFRRGQRMAQVGQCMLKIYIFMPGVGSCSIP